MYCLRVVFAIFALFSINCGLKKRGLVLCGSRTGGKMKKVEGENLHF